MGKQSPSEWASGLWSTLRDTSLCRRKRWLNKERKRQPKEWTSFSLHDKLWLERVNNCHRLVPSIPHAINKEIFLILNATQLIGIRCNTLLQLVQPCSRKVLSDKNVPHCGVILGVIFKHIWNKLHSMSVLHQGVKLGPAITQGEPTSKCQKKVPHLIWSPWRDSS